mmetsp:Transcript_5377/g.12985  ORF Transcript_5377/g.12985 Transcript_5377/m.12985 type:complete len:293 (+) Transcript_5377:1868-2746(+)
MGIMRHALQCCTKCYLRPRGQNSRCCCLREVCAHCSSQAVHSFHLFKVRTDACQILEAHHSFRHHGGIGNRLVAQRQRLDRARIHDHLKEVSLCLIRWRFGEQPFCGAELINALGASQDTFPEEVVHNSLSLGRSLTMQADLFVLDVLVDVPHEELRQTATTINARVILHKLWAGHTLLDVWVVQVCVQHDDGVGEHEDCVGTRHLHAHLLVVAWTSTCIGVISDLICGLLSRYPSWSFQPVTDSGPTATRARWSICLGAAPFQHQRLTYEVRFREALHQALDQLCLARQSK